MVVAIVVTLGFTFALAAVVVGVGAWLMSIGEFLAGYVFVAGVLVMTVAGWGASQRAVGRTLEAQAASFALGRVEPRVSRLSLLADLAPPRAAIERTKVPLSWTSAAPGRTPSIHLTTGLLDRISDEGLEAVIAHELSHIANRDASVMTIVGSGASWFLRGLRLTRADNHARWHLFALFFPAIVVALPGTVASCALSRHREFAADRSAARLTGSPAGVAAALVELSEGIREIPTRDLRKVQDRDVFHFVPARRAEVAGFRRLFVTHPPLAARLAELEEMERVLHAARPVLAP